MKEMLMFHRGGVYPGIIPQDEGVFADFFRPDNNLLIFMPGISRHEATDYRKGKIRMAIHEGENVAMLFFKFGRQPWIDAPFHAGKIEDHLFEQTELIGRNSSPNLRFWVMMTLIESDTRIVKGLRGFSLSPKFSRRLQEIALRQRLQGRPGVEYERELASLLSVDTETLLSREKPEVVGQVN